jgi:hypothetical protein
MGLSIVEKVNRWKSEVDYMNVLGWLTTLAMFAAAIGLVIVWVK